jgi:dynein heavy chain
MPRLEQLVTADLPAAASSHDPDQRPHPDFRLWLTSAPSPDFPAPVLQASSKVALEPPRGVRARALRALASLPAACWPSCDAAGRGPEWRRLLLSGVLLHAVVLERRRYGALGWTRPYEFSDGDLSCSLSTLQLSLQDGGAARRRQPADAERGGAGSAAAAAAASTPSSPAAGALHSWVPWEGLRYLTGQIIYGGRVTAEHDRRLLAALVGRHLCPRALAPFARLAGGWLLFAFRRQLQLSAGLLMSWE